MTLHSKPIRNENWHHIHKTALAGAVAVAFVAMSGAAWGNIWCEAWRDRCLRDAAQRRLDCEANERYVKELRREAARQEYERCAAEQCDGENDGQCAIDNCLPALHEKYAEIDRDYESGMRCCEQQAYSDRDACYRDFDCTSW
jgi:hypothetical protein